MGENRELQNRPTLKQSCDFEQGPKAIQLGKYFQQTMLEQLDIHTGKNEP